MKNKSVVYAFGMEVRSNKNTEEGQRFHGRFCAWCSIPRPVGSAPVDFAMPGKKSFFLNNWKNLNSARPFITRISIRGSGRNRGHFFLSGGAGTPLLPSSPWRHCPHTPHTKPRTPPPPPRPPSQGGPEKVTEEGAKTMNPPRLYENDEIDEIDEIDEKNRRNRRIDENT